MADRLGFELFVDDNGSANVTKFGTAMKKAAADLESAQVRLAKATQVAGTATEKYGKDSLQAREAVARLHQAEVAVEGATNKHAAAQKAAGGQIEEATKKTGKLSGALQQAGATMAGVFGAQVVTAGLQKFQSFASDSVEAASSLGESMNAVQKVFGDGAKTITDWGSKSAASYGLSQRAFQEMATPLGSGLKNAGLSMQDTSKWTIDLTKRASDMASVFNTSVPDALEAIQAGLRGEADPLERYGVGLSAAAVQAEALSETHKKAASSLTNTELATARLNLIMKQTSSTAGDFTQTSTGYANAQRIASAEMENAKAKLGEGLLPIMAKVTSTTASAVSGFASLPAPIQAGATGLVALGGAAVLALPRLKSAKDAAVDLGLASEASAGRIGMMAKTAGKIGAAITTVAIAGQILGKDVSIGTNTATAALEEYARTGSMSSKVTSDLSGDLKVLADTGFQGVQNKAESALEQLTGASHVALPGFQEGIGIATDRVNALDAGLAQMVSSGHGDMAAAAFAKLQSAAKEQGVSVDGLARLLPQYNDALAAAEAKNKTAAAAIDATGTVTKRQADAFTKANTDAQTYANGILGLVDAESGYYAAIDSVSGAVKENGRTLDVRTEKGRANAAVVKQVATSIWAESDALKTSGVTAQEFNEKLDGMRQGLVNTLVQMGLSGQEAVDYAAKILAIPRGLSTDAEFVKAQATADAMNWKEFLKTLPPSVATRVDLKVGSAISVLDGVISRIGYINGHPAVVSVLSSSANVRESRTSATGGRVPGAPSSVDTEPYLLAKGEFVVNSRATSQNLATLEAINSGRGRGMASGGYVGIRPMAAPSAPGAIRLEWIGGDADGEFMAWLRKNIRVRGGLQAALG